MKILHNHDVTIGEMIDKEDEEKMGLLGRHPEVQFVRLAGGYNDIKRANQELQRTITNLRKLIGGASRQT